MTTLFGTTALVLYRDSNAEPATITIDAEGAATFSAMDMAKNDRKSYIRTAEEFAHALLHHEPGEVMPSNQFALLCDAATAARAADNWTHLTPKNKEYQILVKRKDEPLIQVLGETNGEGVVKIRGLLVRMDLTKNTGVDIYKFELVVSLKNSTRLHQRYITPYIVTNFTYDGHAAN